LALEVDIRGMAITFTEQKKKQKNLVLIFVILLVIIGIVLTQQLLKRLSLNMAVELSVTPFAQPQIDFKFLESQALKDLEPFEGIGPFLGTIGRENPFIPYPSISEGRR
jgi:hypothetical protein